MATQHYLEEKKLLDRYRNGLCSPQEELLVNHWFNQQSKSLSNNFAEPDYDELRNEIWLRLPASSRPVKRLKLFMFKRIAAAAVLLIAFGLGLYFYAGSGNKQGAARYLNDVAPGGNKIILTFENGKTVHLSNSKTGVIINNTQLKYNDGTEISDPVLTSDVSSTLVASTPRGGIYQVMLSDGTHVWLNAATKMKFPVKFSGKDRRITLDGEAYFEVAKDKKHPFVIQTAKQELTVLGTHFNLNSYRDESSVKTTLLEGSVRVTAVADSHSVANKSIVLKPDQQSVLTADHKITISNVDVNEFVDWKNSKFIFKGEVLESVMRRVSRWYNVDVVFGADLPKNIYLGGVVSRSLNISSVLDLLERTGVVDVKLKGRTVTITKKEK